MATGTVLVFSSIFSFCFQQSKLLQNNVNNCVIVDNEKEKKRNQNDWRSIQLSCSYILLITKCFYKKKKKIVLRIQVKTGPKNLKKY